MLRHVDLCSGIGGFALGFEWAGVSRPVLFCDIDRGVVTYSKALARRANQRRCEGACE